jgi:hypothetical protein
MAEIRITIPADKMQLVLDAVTFYIQNEGSEEEVTGQIALSWIKKQLMGEIKRLVRNYQEQMYREEFKFNDPLD